MPQSGILVKQWKSMKLPAIMAGFISPLAGTDAWNIFDKKIGGAMNSILNSAAPSPSDKVPASVKFDTAYEKTYKKPLQAGHGPAPSYIGVHPGGSHRTCRQPDPDALVAAIEKTDRTGVMGRIRDDV